MLLRSNNIVRTSWSKFKQQYLQKCAQSTSSGAEQFDISRVRNIGILAHIDAGKTTTTERMLFYSGLIKHMGEVHHGNTVTDYMDQERERGITITSASVTFNWKNYRFNLIDTPGHIDFTMEVEQSLYVLDGVIVVLDGSAGVEPQTLTVCRQADKYEIPKIIYINKMDRSDGDLDMCINSIEKKLDTETFPIHFPIKENNTLIGIVDIVSLQKLIFHNDEQKLKTSKADLSEKEDGELWYMANEKRSLLIDKLSGVDDKLAEIIIEQETLQNINPQVVTDSLRRITLARKGVPVLVGSSYKNIGIQPLMDSIILYLPSPGESKNARRYRCFNNNLSGRAFKIVHDKQRGPITFCRIYSGTMNKGCKLYNAQKDKMEQSTRLYVACADDYKEVSEVEHGNIAAIAGLKNTTSGDLLTKSDRVLQEAKLAMEKDNDVNPNDIKKFFASIANVPKPVFFCTIEAPSMSLQKHLDTALEELEREDPSLEVRRDENTDETILGGMGELHIEIIKERIRSKYKVDVDLGPLQIAYKEMIQDTVKDSHVVDCQLGNKKQKVTAQMSVIPNYKSDKILILDKSSESWENLKRINEKTMRSVEKGVRCALSCGPKLNFPVMDTGVKLHFLEIHYETSQSMIIAAVTQCIKNVRV